MGLIVGTNCGFVLAAPTADPTGTNRIIDGLGDWWKVTAPNDLSKITEMGWYCGANSGTAGNFELGVYAHNSGTDLPTTKIFSIGPTSGGTTTGWKPIITDQDMSAYAGQVLWLALQMDAVTGNTYVDYDSGVAGQRRSYQSGISTLPATHSSTGTTISPIAVYALYTSSAVMVPRFMYDYRRRRS